MVMVCMVMVCMVMVVVIMVVVIMIVMIVMIVMSVTVAVPMPVGAIEMVVGVPTPSATGKHSPSQHRSHQHQEPSAERGEPRQYGLWRERAGRPQHRS